MFISGRSALWIFIWVFSIVSFIFLFYIGPSSSFIYTYQLGRGTPPQPGALYSQRWTYDFWIVAMFVFVWSVPLTLAFAMDTPDTSTRWRMHMHLIIVILLMLWYCASLFYGAFLWSKVNQNSPDNYANPFNDARYCCVYHVVAQAYCFNTVDCVPEPQPSDLGTNGATLFQWSYNLLLVVFLGLDLAMFFTIVKPTFDEAEIKEMQDNGEEPLLEVVSEIPMSQRRLKAYRGRK